MSSGRAMRIIVDDLTGPQVRALMREHLDHMASLSPPESVHALDLDRLRQPDVTFWTMWDGDVLVASGALKVLDAEHAEVKSMRTATAYRGQGVAKAMLQHLMDEARRRSYRRLSLETGSTPEFEPARRLYLRAGFVDCAPFADYRPDPFSVYMTRSL